MLVVVVVVVVMLANMLDVMISCRRLDYAVGGAFALCTGQLVVALVGGHVAAV